MEIDREERLGAIFPTALPHIQLFRESQPLSFAAAKRSISSNPAFIQRIELRNKLEGHGGCVNTCSFTPCGSYLLSGSDDMLIKIWDWQQGKQVFSWKSGHFLNVFQAKVLTNTLNQSPLANLTVVSSAADGQIRVAHVINEGRVAHRCVYQHNDAAHKLALIPDTPWTFLSCGEDGQVYHHDLRVDCPPDWHPEILKVYDTSGILMPLYSIACNPVKPTEFCIGGCNDAVRVFDLRKVSTGTAAMTTKYRALPLAFISPHRIIKRDRFVSSFKDVSVTAAVYSCRGEILASYNDENIYLIAADVASGIAVDGGGGSGGGDGKFNEDDTTMYFGSSSSPSSSIPSNKSTRSQGGKLNNPRHRQENDLNSPRALRSRRRLGQDDDEQQQNHQRQQAGGTWRRGRGVEARNRNQLGRTEELDAVVRMRYFKYKDGEKKEKKMNKLNSSSSSSPVDDRDILDIPGSFVAMLYAERERGVSTGIGSRRNFDSDAIESSESDENDSGSGSDNNDDIEEYSSLDSIEFLRRALPDSDIESEEDEDDILDSRVRTEEESDEDEKYIGVDEAGCIKNDDDDLASRWPVPRLYNWTENTDGKKSSSELYNKLESFSSDCQGGVLQMYQGHRNHHTVKGVSFFGLNDEWVISGSDCGHFYFWNTKTGEAVASLQGDAHVVNCLERHPHDIFTLATSGIDDDVKIWSCTAAERVDGLSAKDLTRMKRNIVEREEAERPMVPRRRVQLRRNVGDDSESESEEED